MAKELHGFTLWLSSYQAQKKPVKKVPPFWELKDLFQMRPKETLLMRQSSDGGLSLRSMGWSSIEDGRIVLSLHYSAENQGNKFQDRRVKNIRVLG